MSASLDFVTWLKLTLTKYYGVRGYTHKGAGVYNYVKGDIKKLSEIMYSGSNILYLTRKYSKIMTALERDKEYGLPFLQKPRNAGVA